jgi:hypothetical protein
VTTVKNLLDAEDFDPLNIDITEFEDLAKSMPQDASFDLYTAETLAIKYLRAADRCSGILMMLTSLEMREQSKRNAVRGRLFLRAKDEGYKTVEEKKAFVDSHDELLQAENILSAAHTAKKYFEMRHEHFLKSHQFMKERIRGEQRQLSSSGFEAVALCEDGKVHGEKDW